MVDINTITVIGAGTMGSGIATIALIANYNVNLVDIKEEFLSKAKAKIEKNLQKSVEKEVITEKTRAVIINNLVLTTDFSSVGESELIIEAVSENMEIKKQLFSKLCKYASESTIIASNTSALNISDLANLYKEPENVLGMHFFNPPIVMKLVELIKTETTSEEVFASSKAFVASLGKEAVEVIESPGFVVNRVLIPMINEAAMVYGEGVASAKDIDTAMTLGANHPIGPLALADMIGIDVCHSVMETLKRDLNSDKYEPAPIFKKMIKMGKLGRKSGAGFHDYSEQLAGTKN